MTIEVSLVDLIFRGVVGIGTIIVLILIIREWRKTAKFLKEDSKFLKEKLAEPDDDEDDGLPVGEWVKMEDVQKVIPPILKRFYNATDGDIEYVIQEIEQKAWLIK